MLQSMLAAHKFLSNLFQLFSPSRCTTREKFSSQQRQKRRMFILLCLGKAYLLSCCSELYLQSTATKPSALIAVAQVEYLLSTLKYEVSLMQDLSNKSHTEGVYCLTITIISFLLYLTKIKGIKKPSVISRLLLCLFQAKTADFLFIYCLKKKTNSLQTTDRYITL